jgi:glycerophosphoryl diester phosphodiesterase
MSEEYLQVLGRWTREKIIYSQFDTQAHIIATLRSPEFNRAYLLEYARIYQLGADELKNHEAMRAASEFTEFIFYAHIPDRTENDFDRRGSIWSIFLVNSKGEKISPVEVRRVDPVTPVVTGFFTYIKPHYGISYWLRFPLLEKIGSVDGTLKLVFASVIGKVELEFSGR